ncbi:hypothetical protein [Fusibacter tunisiensis]|uniref:Uncharacterized protein n=1 Tax=Fusibacter tunisiensis TaxID=1008308 RepID=A0ABS2MTL9_9FIRM|nr:hypothetical protein [Fusibacter tunisiensis]MBM7562728.1 hypothetical protein [Fusibacter tunisiensis]
MRFNLPLTFTEGDYLQVPPLKRFLKSNNVPLAEVKDELITALRNFASESDANKTNAITWLSKAIKEGTKDFCYRKFYISDQMGINESIITDLILQAFPDYIDSNIIETTNSYEMKLVKYEIKKEDDEIAMISFTFSRLYLEGSQVNTTGQSRIYPVFVDVDMKEGFIIGRSKGKATLYEYDEENLLVKDNKVTTVTQIVQCIKLVENAFSFMRVDVEATSSVNSQILNYKLYNEFSMTPEFVIEKMNQVEELKSKFAKDVFDDLELDYNELGSALDDLGIFLEKYISLSVDNEEIFKQNRLAYLTKVSSEDEADLTRVDTVSSDSKPLQCTPAFFDGKKAVIKSGRCKVINLSFKKQVELYQTAKFFSVKFGNYKGYGYFKTVQHAEEGDINNVIQTIYQHF